MVDDPANYSWSSYRVNALSVESKLHTPHPLYLRLGKTKLQRLSSYRELFQPHIDGELLIDIRYALNKGLVLGTDRFKAEVEELTGRRVHPMKRGRPRA